VRMCPSEEANSLQSHAADQARSGCASAAGP
jgi:hypothetical protein